MSTAAICLVGCGPVYETGVSVQQPIRRIASDGGAMTGEQAPADYRINPGDLVGVKFPRRPAYSDNFLVRPDGKISAPWLGSVPAAGRTTDELQSALATRYGQLARSLPPPSQRRYLLQSDDLLDIRLAYMPEMNSEVTVRGDGRISVPLLGDVIAEGKTPEDLASELSKGYARKQKGEAPNVVVIVKEARSNTYEHDGVVQAVPDPGLTEVSVNVARTIPLQIYVAGEVPAPGVQPFVSNIGALQAIYTAGGPVPTADMRSVVVLRRGQNDGVLRIVSDLSKDLAGRGTDNIVLQPFDVVIVPRSTIAKVGDTLDQYIYRALRPLANSSVGFFFTRQVGTVEQQQTLIPASPGP